MSGGNGNLIRKGYEAWNVGDRSFVLEHFAPDVVWVTPPDDPDQGVYRGHDAVIGFWDQWRAAVGQLKFEVLEVLESGSRVLAIVRRSGIGAQSGLSVSDTVCQVFFFDEDGRCSLIREFYDRKRAEATVDTESAPTSATRAFSRRWPSTRPSGSNERGGHERGSVSRAAQSTERVRERSFLQRLPPTTVAVTFA